MHRTALGLVFALLALAGCAEGADTDTGQSASGITTATIGTSGSPTATDATGTPTGSGTDTGTASGGVTEGDPTTSGGHKFDLPAGGDLGGADESCAKVDLLFIVDNSYSMEEEQATLIANFPTFSSQIQTQLAEVDSYHVMVTSTDSYDAILSDTSINDDDPACQVIGAAITKSKVGVCTPYAEGHRYMTEMDDLDARFACAANLGVDGSGQEMVGDAIVGALSATHNGPGGCQEGFLRDDALLVIVILTDEDDAEHSEGPPQAWYDAVVAAKKGLPDNVVVLSLVWDDSDGNPYNCTGNGDPPDQEYGATIVQFTQMFKNGSVGNICAADYGPFFSAAIGVIDSACDDFTPPR